MADAITKNLSTGKLRDEKQAHVAFVDNEESEYMQKIELSILRQSKNLSAVIVGAEQHALELRRLRDSEKDQRVHILKVQLIGCLQHANLNSLRL